MEANSRRISSSQTGIHENLEKTVRKYLTTDFQRPYAQHTIDAFKQAEAFISEQDKPLILDACCGTAISTMNIAREHPGHCVIGVDKSIARLSKQHELPDNALILQADLLDFYRLAADAGWQLDKHFLLYPNPWPKVTHLKRRWHAMPSFPHMMKLGGRLEVRSNWKIYVDEFVCALSFAGVNCETEHFSADTPITAFEKKYRNSGHDLWRCVANLS